MRKTNFGRRLCWLILFAVVGSAWEQTVTAEVRLPRVFGRHMVLQQEKPLVVWGWSDANEIVTVTLGSDPQEAEANERGEWKVTLPARKAGGPFTFKVSGSSSVVFEDVLIGAVWLASGQSNMEMGIGACRDGKAEIAAANYPAIRLLLWQTARVPSRRRISKRGNPARPSRKTTGKSALRKPSPRVAGVGSPPPPIISNASCINNCASRSD